MKKPPNSMNPQGGRDHAIPVLDIVMQCNENLLAALKDHTNAVRQFNTICEQAQMDAGQRRRGAAITSVPTVAQEPPIQSELEMVLKVTSEALHSALVRLSVVCDVLESAMEQKTAIDIPQMCAVLARCRDNGSAVIAEVC